MGEQRGLFEVFRTNAWIEDDCKIKTCIDGVIFTSKGAYRCRECKRNNSALLPLPVTMRQPTYSNWEMEERKKEREKVVTDPAHRHRRSMELINAIKKVWDSPKKKDKVYISDEEVPF